MSILGDSYIFYADVYFIQNFLIKIAVLYLCLFSNRCHWIIFSFKGVIRIIIAAGVGTIIEIIGLFFGDSYYVFLLLVHVLEIPCMVWVILGKEKKQIVRIMICGYFFLMLINSVLEVLWNWFGEAGNYVFMLCASCGFVYIGICAYLNERKMRKGIFPVEIFHYKKRFTSYGFYDSGNRLIDPYTQKGVHIISEQLWKQMGLEKEAGVLVPFQSLGNEEGVVKVYYVDELVIGVGKERKKWHRCPFGVTKDNLFEGKKYEIILSEEVF